MDWDLVRDITLSVAVVGNLAGIFANWRAQRQWKRLNQALKLVVVQAFLMRRWPVPLSRSAGYVVSLEIERMTPDEWQRAVGNLKG